LPGKSAGIGVADREMGGEHPIASARFPVLFSRRDDQSLATSHGEITFPCFMPVTTFGYKCQLDEVLRPYLTIALLASPGVCAELTFLRGFLGSCDTIRRELGLLSLHIWQLVRISEFNRFSL
jgi:hypothetical protein